MATSKALESRDQYTVGWIAALPIERAAATAMLDEQHKKPLDFIQPPNDTNSYTWGQIAEHNVVIALLPLGVYGTTSAATTATHMLSSFPQIRVGLMVGIGAGIPRPDQEIDIRLGDIVISQPSGRSGGVIQYDFGKAKTGDRFERTGSLNSPPQALLNALAALQAQHEFGSKIPKILQDMLEKHPQLARATPRKPSYAYQGREHDKLFNPAYEHTQGKNCDKCDSEQEVKREERELLDPEIYYGLIASGNKLIRDVTTRDSILSELDDNCICFEMEAAGLMNNFPCIVVRGICDYADSHKNDRWQRYAAATAAAYAKEFLGVVPGEDVERTRRAAEMIENRRCREVVLATRQQKIDKWLSPSHPSTNYNKATDQRHQGSGQWFLQSEAYLAWKKEQNSFLWLHGIPGCGKTILSSTVVEDLERSEACSQTLLYFYFDFTDRDKQSLEDAVRSLISQLYYRKENVRRHLDSLYSSCENGKRQPNIASLRTTLQNMIQQADEVWLVLDALDECPIRSGYPTGGLLPWIHSLRDTQMNVHLLVTSRPEQDIESTIEKWARKEDIIPIQGDLIAEDIRAYVRTRVREHEGLSRWKSRPDIRSEIEVALIEKSNGMFRWVSCQLDALEKCCDPRTLRTALNTLPKTLDETYARILKDIPHEHLGHTTRILQFLTFGERPLRITEAVDLITVDTSNTPRFDPKNRMPVPKEISRYCSSLVVITRRDSYDEKQMVPEIQLAHFSVKEYLTSNRLEKDISKYFEETFARAAIAEICLGYLLELDQNLTTKEIRQSFSLAQYSAQYWISHAVVAESCSHTVRTLVMELFSHESTYETCYMLYNPDIRWNNDPSKDDLAFPLYYASLAGLIYAVQRLIEKNADVNAQGGEYGNALQAASYRGHEKVVQILLEKNADVNAQGGPYGNALQAASSEGHEKVVQILLEKNADVNAQGGPYGNALQAASSEGHEKVVQILLEKNADVNAQGGHYGNALQASSSGGHENVVQILLEKNADVNAHGGFYGNALQAASYRGHEKVVQILLEKNADVNAQGGEYGNALQAASYRGHEKVVQILLEKNADVNAHGGFYGNALQAASLGGHEKVVQILLEKNADVNAQGRPYGNALQAASYRGHEKVVQILLEKNADVNAQGGYYGNALQAASLGGHEKVVQILLEKNADVNAQGGHYGNALQASSSGGHENVVQILIEKNADVNAQGGLYGNALQAASYRGHEKVVQILLEKNADVNAQGGFYGNALQAASSGGHENVVQILLEKNADVNAQGGLYGNALQAASLGGHEKVVQILLEKNADVNAHGGFYGNALQAASYRGHEKVVQILLEKNADVNAQGGPYGNALQAASSEGHEKVVQILLEKNADVNAQGGHYGNALQAASSEGHEKVVQILLEKNADVNAQGGYYGNALQASSSGGHEKVVQILLEKNADVNAQGGEYGNALQAASSGGHENVVQILLNKGADLTVTNSTGWTPLNLASDSGHVEVVKLLLEKGADVRTTDRHWQTPLILSASKGHNAVVELLLTRHVNINGTDVLGKSALLWAAKGNHKETVRILLSQDGINPDLGDNKGRTALSWAAGKGYEGVMELLLQNQMVKKNSRDGNGCTPLIWAAWKSYAGAVEMLVRYGSRPCHADRDRIRGVYGDGGTYRRPRPVWAASSI
ncbi:ankyrin repeat-containing domain protein [Pseudomassariella vexata]|uniref:Ankyrin repeat-containing domain protein n=1 Tax=Pseudomassariella vexata TaxID=1141098 RepID=A0A1Y2EA79_9PEZI|nr:ankyrin repeat-containing domain protein [Pseudomassariella vexata]ORY67765.1 ankyrin repeat-containing domain protein [Pseudomassariella vexata]